MVKKIVCSLEGGSEKRHFTGVFTWVRRNDGQGWLKAKINHLTKAAICLGGEYTPSPAHLGIHDEISLWDTFFLFLMSFITF